MSPQTPQVVLKVGDLFPVRKGFRYEIEKITLIPGSASASVTLITPGLNFITATLTTIHGPFVITPASDNNLGVTGDVGQGTVILTGVTEKSVF